MSSQPRMASRRENVLAAAHVATHVAVPADPDGIDARLVTAREPDSDWASRYRVLRYRLREAGDPRVILVSSARREEGRTTCAANLGVALAEEDAQRIVLVEGQLVGPQLACIFGFEAPSCLCSELRDRKRLEQERGERGRGVSVAEVRVGGGRVHVAAIKENSERPAHLGGLGATELLSALRAPSAYDYVIVDGPPVLGGSDAHLLASVCDGYIMTAWKGRTRSSELRRATAELGDAGCLGVVFFGD